MTKHASTSHTSAKPANVPTHPGNENAGKAEHAPTAPRSPVVAPAVNPATIAPPVDNAHVAPGATPFSTHSVVTPPHPHHNPDFGKPGPAVVTPGEHAPTRYDEPGRPAGVPADQDGDKETDDMKAKRENRETAEAERKRTEHA